MPTTTTCPHGLNADTCLICETLLPTTKGHAVPAGKAEVLPADSRPRRGLHVGVLGGMVLMLAVLVGAWVVYHLLWGLFRLIELMLVGGVCGVIGYRIGVVVGRHRGRP